MWRSGRSKASPSNKGPSPAAGTLFPRSLGAFGPQGPTLGAFGQPIPVALRQAALQQVDQDLVKQGLLDKVGGQVSPAAKPGLLVKGCLDDCDICEPELKRLMDLEATRKDLEN